VIAGNDERSMMFKSEMVEQYLLGVDVEVQRLPEDGLSDSIHEHAENISS
jgi:hypothetical protein